MNILKTLFTDKILIKRFFFVLFGLFLFRAIASIPTPGVDLQVLQGILSGNEFLGIFNIFSGGGLENFSIAMLGVFPYITVSIVMQLLTSVIPQLHDMYHEEGELGRRKFLQYTRVISAPVAALNAFGLLIFFQSQLVIPAFDTLTLITNISVITAGSILLMWLGELITEYGIGNGISLIVFGGIVVNIPTFLGQSLFSYELSALPIYIVGIATVIALVWLAVHFQEAERPIPITYARADSATSQRVSTYLPIKPNPSGVLPIIFALTMIVFFTFAAQRLSEIDNIIGEIGGTIHSLISNNYWYALAAIVFVVFFTYFYTPIVVNTEKMSKNLQQNGAFIPGIRPGEETKEKIDTILFRVIFFGAIFLAIITAIPILAQDVISSSGSLLAIGGSAILIVVSVILDIHRKVKAHIMANSL